MATRHLGALPRVPIAGRAGVPLRLPRPAQRTVLVALACVAAGAVAYALARETPLFAAREIVVASGSASAKRDVRARIASLGGVSLVALDPKELEEELEGLPAVHEASVDRAFPHTLSVAIHEERPLAVLEEGKRAVLVSRRGRAIREVSPRSLPRVPRIPTEGLSDLDPGAAASADGVARALEALAHVPRRFPLRVASAGSTEEGIVLTLEGEVELLLGDGADLRHKIAAAGAVLRSLSARERAAVAYVDATLPNRIVASANPQLEG